MGFQHLERVLNREDQHRGGNTARHLDRNKTQGTTGTLSHVDRPKYKGV